MSMTLYLNLPRAGKHLVSGDRFDFAGLVVGIPSLRLLRPTRVALFLGNILEAVEKLRRELGAVRDRKLERRCRQVPLP